MGQVLVLNASYEPLNITSWRRAVVMVLKGKAEGLEHDGGRQIRSDLMQPTVIRLRQFVRVPYRPLPLTRRNLFQRDGHRCQYCGSRQERLSVDHVLPRSRGGMDTWENVTTACLSCNVRKGNRTLSGPGFEATRLIRSGHHGEWAKYVIGVDVLEFSANTPGECLADQLPA
jgi:5-methylcytosine-specific restriction endonuclease McrA